MRGIVVLPGLAASLLALTLAAGVVGERHSRRASADPRRVAEEFGIPGGRASRWAPAFAAGSGITMAVTELHGKPCIFYRGAGQGGGSCFVSGWAVESRFIPAVNGTLVVGVAIPATKSVRFGKGNGAPRVQVVNVPGRARERYFAWVLPSRRLRSLKPNDIVALDARGRLLGRQHYNDGHGGFGSYNGRFDRTLK